MEIALKIANKIKANERFSAYIVIPMWPEGVPTANATQRILYWQVHTCAYSLMWSFFSLFLFLTCGSYNPPLRLSFISNPGSLEPQASHEAPIAFAEARGLLLYQTPWGSFGHSFTLKVGS